LIVSYNTHRNNLDDGIKGGKLCTKISWTFVASILVQRDRGDSFIPQLHVNLRTYNVGCPGRVEWT
jgi:hypothetical protein